MNLRQIEVFRAVMLTGGVSGAAQLLHVSQPAISKVLAQAARQAGFPLFERVKGRLIPTSEAQQLHREVESLWRGVERVRDVSRSLANPQSGTLRLAVTASLAPYLAPQAIARLYQAFPSVRSELEILIPPIMVEGLLDQTLDLGVALQPNEHPNLVAVQTYRCGLACAMRQDHPLAAKKMVKPSDLRGERLVTSSPGTPYGQALLRAFGAESEHLRLDLSVRSSTTACWCAQAGAGVAIVDQAAVAGQTFANLAVRPFQGRERMEIQILRNRYRPLTIVQKAFCEAFDAVWKASMPA